MHNPHVLALAAVVTVVGALAVILPQDHASAADDTITIRAQLDDAGNVIIQRHYSALFRWVTVGVIAMDEPQDWEVFEYGAMTLAVEFIPKFRLPLPQEKGYVTGYLTYNGEQQCWKEDIYNEEGNVVGQTDMCEPWYRVAEVTCQWGWRVIIGPFYTVQDPFLAGGWAVNICDHGRLLREGGLTNPSEMITLEELQSMVTAALAAAGETRPLEAIPVRGTRSNPIHSETTYVDIRVAPAADGEDTPTVNVQARGGGQQQTLALDQSTTVGVYSLPR